MADETKISKEQLQNWVENAYWSYLSEYTVPWVAAESPHGLELGMKWIESDVETTAAAGWATLAYYTSVNPDENIDIELYSSLLKRVEKDIDNAQNRVKYAMNGFVISIASYVESLTEKAMDVGKNIGKIEVFMRGTACKVPLATEYIKKVKDRGSIGKKRKTARC